MRLRSFLCCCSACTGVKRDTRTDAPSDDAMTLWRIRRKYIHTLYIHIDKCVCVYYIDVLINAHIIYLNAVRCCRRCLFIIVAENKTHIQLAHTHKHTIVQGQSWALWLFYSQIHPLIEVLINAMCKLIWFLHLLLIYYIFINIIACIIFFIICSYVNLTLTYHSSLCSKFKLYLSGHFSAKWFVYTCKTVGNSGVMLLFFSLRLECA